MKPQQVLDTIITPVLLEMQEFGKYNTLDAKVLLLATHAIGPELGLFDSKTFHMKPEEVIHIARNWSEWPKMTEVVRKISNMYMYGVTLDLEFEVNQRLACLMVMGKYSMAKRRIPGFDDKRGLYDHFRTVYLNESCNYNYNKWCELWKKHGLDEVEL